MMTAVQGNVVNETVDGSSYRAARLAVRLGKRLQQRYGDDIARMYVDQGRTQLEIAQDLVERGILVGGKSMKVARNAVSYALRGNDNPNFGEIYSGRVERDVLDVVSRAHQLDATSLGGSTARDLAAGVHGKTQTELGGYGVKGAIARGRVPWSLAERTFYLLLRGDSLTPADIGELLNVEFHNGREIRTNKSVHQYRKSLERKFGVSL